MKPYLFIYALIAIIGGTQILSAENAIKRGDATVNVIFDGDTESLPQLGAVIYASTPFDENNMSQEYKFERNDNGLSASIPLLTRESIAMIRITDPEGMPYGIGLINISQDKPLEITATYYAENDSMGFKMSNTEGLNRYSIGRDDMNKSMIIGQACMMICDLYTLEEIINESGLLAADDFSSWQKFSEKIEPLRQLEYTIAGINEVKVPEAEPWFENGIRRYFICQWPMNFVRNAGYFGVEVETPALEYYTFLNTLDISEALLDYYPDLPPFYLFKQILLKVPGIEPIGEMNVDEWKAKSGQVLSQVINQPLDVLLDMLAAASYVMQIRDDNVPLTAIQKENISAALKADIASYLIEMNDMLERSLSAGVNLYDLSAETSFSLTDFINANYPDRPVVVDVWNTWCQPCLLALQETEPIRHLPEFSDIVFLYVSDESSPIEQWQQLTPIIGGEQIRIGEDARNAMFEQIGSEPMFPTYLFYDCEHTPKHITVSFPGQDEYIRLLDEIGDNIHNAAK